MVVAARAFDLNPSFPANHVDPVVDDVMDIIDEPASQRQVAQRRKCAFVAVVRQQIRRDLLLYELVVWQITVERADDVIAIGVGVGIMSIFLENIPFAVSISRHVQPMTAPSLP